MPNFCYSFSANDMKQRGLNHLFRQALLDANYEDALTIYNTGNINLRCPFINAQTNEVMLPIHFAKELCMMNCHLEFVGLEKLSNLLKFDCLKD